MLRNLGNLDLSKAQKVKSVGAIVSVLVVEYDASRLIHDIKEFAFSVLWY